jgi:hypothetical protein
VCCSGACKYLTGDRKPIPTFYFYRQKKKKKKVKEASSVEQLNNSSPYLLTPLITTHYLMIGSKAPSRVDLKERVTIQTIMAK